MIPEDAQEMPEHLSMKFTEDEFLYAMEKLGYKDSPVLQEKNFAQNIVNIFSNTPTKDGKYINLAFVVGVGRAEDSWELTKEDSIDDKNIRQRRKNLMNIRDIMSIDSEFRKNESWIDGFKAFHKVISERGIYLPQIFSVNEFSNKYTSTEKQLHAVNILQQMYAFEDAVLEKRLNEIQDENRRDDIKKTRLELQQQIEKITIERMAILGLTIRDK